MDAEFKKKQESEEKVFNYLEEEKDLVEKLADATLS
jgi:hypothetical protein